MAADLAPDVVKELTQKALQANKEHQYALRIYTERLEAELEAVDKLIEASEDQEEEEVDAGGIVLVPGAVKAAGLIPSDIELDDHPFADDAERRQRFVQATVIHPMKSAEFTTLQDAVRAENHRIFALDAQRRGRPAFLDPNVAPGDFLNTNKVGINWERVAAKVSAAGTSNVLRTAQECEIRWLGDRHPEVNHAQWDKTEIAKVKELVGDATEGQIDWVDIAKRLGTNRTPVDCMRHAIPRKQHSWSPESDKRLLRAVEIYGTGSWMLVARQVSEDVTAAQCQNRYTRSLDPTHKRGTWSEEEDEQLRRAVDVFGRAWIEVSTYVPTRSSEQCRDRWQEVMNPGSGRGKWTREEDQTLLDAYATVGEGKWVEISLLVGNGRTSNMCRHRYAALKKRESQSNSATATPELSVPPTPVGCPDPLIQDNGSNNARILPSNAFHPVLPQEPVLQEPVPRSNEDCGIVAAVTTSKPKPRPRRRAKDTVTTSSNTSGKSPAAVNTDLAHDTDHAQGSSVSDSAPTAPQDLTPTPTPLPSVEALRPVRKRRGRPPKHAQSSHEDESATPPAKRRKTTRKTTAGRSSADPEAPTETETTAPTVTPCENQQHIHAINATETHADTPVAHHGTGEDVEIAEPANRASETTPARTQTRRKRGRGQTVRPSTRVLRSTAHRTAETEPHGNTTDP